MAMTAFAHAQESCDFLTLDAVSKALPQYQPWRVAGGSTGRCRFEGENRTLTDAEQSAVKSLILIALARRSFEAQ